MRTSGQRVAPTCRRSRLDRLAQGWDIDRAWRSLRIVGVAYGSDRSESTKREEVSALGTRGSHHTAAASAKDAGTSIIAHCIGAAMASLPMRGGDQRSPRTWMTKMLNAIALARK